MATDPRYMSFDHQYVETVSTSASIEAHRFVTRAGAYAGGGLYAAGVSVYDAPGQGELTAKGYQVEDGTNAVYEGQLNPSTTPAKPGVFPYQGLLSIVTEGIVIVEVLDGATGDIALDDAVAASGTDGKAYKAATGNLILGRALDVAANGVTGRYIRVKLQQAGAEA
jgi:hypothetical protein